MKTRAGYIAGSIFFFVALINYIYTAVFIADTSRDMYLILGNLWFALGIMLVVITVLIERAANHVIAVIRGGQNKGTPSKDKA